MGFIKICLGLIDLIFIESRVQLYEDVIDIEVICYNSREETTSTKYKMRWNSSG